MKPELLTIKGKFPNYTTLTLGDSDLLKDMGVTRIAIDMPAGDVATASITAYVLSEDIEIYVKPDITLEARYNGKIYRLVEVEAPKGTQ